MPKTGNISSLGGAVGLVCAIPTVAALAFTFFGIASLASISTRQEYEQVFSQGKRGLEDLERYFRTNTRTEAIKVRIGYLDFIDKGVRFVQHTRTNYIEQIKIDGRWRV